MASYLRYLRDDMMLEYVSAFILNSHVYHVAKSTSNREYEKPSLMKFLWVLSVWILSR